MGTYPEIMADRKVTERFNLNVHAGEERAGFFIIHPFGTINTNTYPILQKEIEWIFESRPDVILFDMKHVKYINFRGLRVFLKTIMEMNQRNGKVYLTNLQPKVKEMFDVMIGTLPEWVFGSRKQLEDCLNANHNNCSGNSQWSKFYDAEKAYNLSLLIKKRRGILFVSESRPMDNQHL